MKRGEQSMFAMTQLVLLDKKTGQIGSIVASAFTPEVKDAWTTVYGVLASTMKAGAEERLAEAS